MAKAGTRGDRMLMGRVVAGMALLGRTGVSDVELAFDDDGPVRWWCGGTRVFSEHFPYPAHAVEHLLSKVLNGGLCARCRHTSVVGLAVQGEFCCFLLTATDLDDDQSYRYVRTCEAEVA